MTSALTLAKWSIDDYHRMIEVRILCDRNLEQSLGCRGFNPPKLELTSHVRFHGACVIGVSLLLI